ncbi:MAG: hypothetical protein EBS42_12005, partial [Caulobacteraceae bacterium]|nr:hypothetical protein [Caulobacteraceae bacterium]
QAEVGQVEAAGRQDGCECGTTDSTTDDNHVMLTAHDPSTFFCPYRGTLALSRRSAIVTLRQGFRAPGR